MKYFIVSMLICTAGVSVSRAQCNSIVHANSVSITQTEQFVNSNKKYWVCDGQTFILKGSHNSVWVEEGAVFSLDGDTNTIFALKTSTVTIAGDNNVVEIDQNATYTNNGIGTTKTTCTPMVFDYTSAPTGGCTPYLNIEGITVVQKGRVYPSPASSELNLELSENVSTPLEIRIFDASGNLVLSKTNVNSSKILTLDISSLSNGIYSIQAENSSVLIHENFIVQH